MDQTIERKIQPLVDALNALPGVRTIASCEGHFSRISRPYVYFHCPPALAETIAARLHDLNMQDNKLSHWWHLTGMFNGEHRLCFSLEAPGLDHDRGFLNKFLNYTVYRKKIDNDLNVLSNAFKNVPNDPVNGRRENSGLIGSVEHQGENNGDAQTNGSVAPFPLGDASERVGVATIGTSAFDAGGDSLSAVAARWRSNHGLSFPSLKTAWNLTRLSVVVMFLTATLSACGTSNVELQQDGTGSDEMLKSPCACLPVPYDPQFYRWDVS